MIDPRDVPLPSADEIANASWFKSTSSDTSQGCVEVAHLDNWTLVRDSKNPDGPVHTYTAHEWQCFLDGALAGEFHRR